MIILMQTLLIFVILILVLLIIYKREHYTNLNGQLFRYLYAYSYRKGIPLDIVINQLQVYIDTKNSTFSLDNINYATI